MRAGRRLVLVLLAGLVPWVVVVTDGAVSLVASFGLVSVAPFHVTPIWSGLLRTGGGLPAPLRSWPVAAVLYLLALGSAVVGWRFDREDARLTGGLLVVTGLALLPVVLAVGRPMHVTALALGSVALWVVAWAGYRAALKRAVLGVPAGGGR